MILVWTFCKNIKINVLDIFVNILISENLINITGDANHVHTFLGRVYHFCPRLILQNIIFILYSNY